MNYRMRTLVIAALGFLLAFAVVPLASARAPESGSTASLSADVQSAGKAAAAKAALAPDTGRVLYASSLENDYVTVIVGDDGRFRMETTGGDPENPNDDYQLLLFGTSYPWSSYTTIRIDGEDFIFGDSDPEETAGGMRDTFWTGTATVQVDQALTLVAGQYPGRNDTLRIAYRVTTLWASGAAPEVGVRIMLDTMLGANDGAPFRVPGGAPVTSEVEYYGDDVPDYWRAFDSLDDPMVSAQGTVRAPGGAMPDRLSLVHWPAVSPSWGSWWDYSIDPWQAITGDSAVCMYWNPQPVPAGSARQVVTHYGLGEPTPVSGAKPVVVFISGLNSNTWKPPDDRHDEWWRDESDWARLIDNVEVSRDYDTLVAKTHQGGSAPVVDSESCDWDESARRLDQQILEYSGSRPVILVGHSMGGLIARAYAERWSSPGFRSGAAPVAVIQLGTPNGGSPAGAISFMLSAWEGRLSTAAAALASPEFMALFNFTHGNMQGVPIYRIGGSYFALDALREASGLSDPGLWAKQLVSVALNAGLYRGEPNDMCVTTSSLKAGPWMGWSGYWQLPAVHGRNDLLNRIWPKAGSVQAFSRSAVWQATDRDELLDERVLDCLSEAIAQGGGGGRGGGWRPVGATSRASATMDLDTTAGSSAALDDRVALSGSSASAPFILEGSAALITAAAASGQLSLTVTDEHGAVVPCDVSTESGVTEGLLEGVNPGAYTLTVAAASGSPQEADVRVLDIGPSSLRLLAPGQAEAGKHFTVQAAVYESGGSAEEPTFTRNTGSIAVSATLAGATQVTLRDNGAAPDAVAGDGIYAAALTAPSSGSLSSVVATATGKDSGGVAFSRQAQTSLAVAEPRAALTATADYRLKTDASGKVTDLLIDVPVTASEACSVRVNADTTSGGALVAQSAADATLAAGESKTIAVTVPVAGLYEGLAEDGSFRVSRIQLSDLTDAMPTTLDEATDVVSGTIPKADVAYSSCSAGLIGPNPAIRSEVVVRGEAVCTTEPISMVQYSFDEGMTWSEVPAPADGWGGHEESWELPLTLEDGSYAIIFRAWGSAAPIEGAEGHVSFSVDTASPYGTFVLAGGAATTFATSVTADATVGNLSAPIEMRFSSDFGTTWSAWGPFAARTTISLPDGFGPKTVYVQYRDANSEVLELDASIELLQPPDTASPVTTASGYDAAWHSSPVTVRFSATDPAPNASGVAHTEYRLDGGAWTRGTSCVVPAPPDTKVTHTVGYRSADVAGNLEAEKTCTVKIDTTVPVPPIKPTITLKLTGLSGGALKLGKVVTASGVVTPVSLMGSRVTLSVQFKKAGVWVRGKTASASISPAGKYRWKYAPAAKGAYRMRATLPAGGTYAAVTTKWLAFKVK